MFTKFYDLSSGGSEKLDWGVIFIEAPEEIAKAVFKLKFGRDPENITCDCCGDDYSIREVKDTEVDEYEKKKGVLIIRKEECL